MTRLTWGEGPSQYDRGVDQGVLYLGTTAVPWNGLVSVDEKASGFVNAEHYFEGNRIHVSQETGDFEATISAYTYPDAFAEYDGYSERESYRRFGFSYRTQHGPDHHKIHLVYNVLVRDDARSWKTDNVRPDPSLFNWDISGEDTPVSGASPTSRMILESANSGEAQAALEAILYGSDTTEPRLPSPDEVLEIYESATTLRVTYNFDGTYTVTGPDSMLAVRPDGSFDIYSPSAHLLDGDRFIVNSY